MIFCVPITCNTVSIQTRMKQIKTSIFSFQNPVLIEFLKIIGVHNQSPISFGTALV